jgi:hypothetical protein
MCYEMGSHAAVRNIQQMKSGCTRGTREIRDADDVVVGYVLAMPLQGV